MTVNATGTATSLRQGDYFDPAELAFTDTLTGLGNRRRFMDKIERLISARADDPAPFAIGIIDLDGFKPINDLFGRAAGDNILQQVALRLNAAMDELNVMTRLGDDEFAFLAPMIFREGDAKDLGQMLDELVGKAEIALYQSKRTGRGKVCVYTREMEEASKRLARIEQALRRAVSAGEVEPHFQPIVNLKTRQTVGFECLARWTDRDLGFVSPAVFIPIAEERGIIGSLTQLLLRKATLAARDWPKDLFLSFNLSPSQLVDQNTGLHILSILEKNGFDPRRLEIEITETGVMTDPASAEKIVEDLRRVGIRVSLDDFGTGQSSLGRLRDFQFDKLKIDRAFVSSILDDRPSEHIIRAILAMCEGLGMDVVAEGIEEEGQADRLVQFGCKGGQGYFFGKPADAQATLGYLRDAFRGAARA
jgi:predicted signal transduction protein with EAL and GGDEF domain